MIRYEMLMAWRRGATGMILFVMLALPVATLIASSDIWAEGIECMCDENGDPYPNEMIPLLENYVVLSAALFVIPVLMLIVPVMMADTIPLDQHYGVSEVLRSLPVSRASYLLGKVGAALGTVLGALALGALMWGAVILFRQYTPDAMPLLSFWLGATLLAITSTALGVLIPAAAKKRSKAVTWGFAAAALAVYFSTTLPLYRVTETAGRLLGRAASPFPPSFPEDWYIYPDPFGQEFLINYAIILVVIGIVTGIAVWRMRVSEASS